MRRDPSIPLFLWVATAALAHILWGGGAEQVAKVIENDARLARFAGAIRQDVEARNRPLEITFLEEEPREQEKPETDTARVQPEPPQVEPEVSNEAPPEQRPKDVETEKLKQQRDQKRERDPKKEEVKEPDKAAEKAEQPKPKAKEPDKPADVEPVQPIELSRRVAVKQHVEKPDEQDNPDAEFLSEHAHRTEKRTQARVTSTDQNEADPNPGVAYQGPSDDPGSSHVSELGQSDSAPGDPNRAFAKSAQDGKDKSNEAKGEKQELPQNPSQAVYGEPSPRARGAQNGSQSSESASRAQQAQQARAASEATDRMLDDPSGEHVVPPQSEQQAAQRERAASRRRAPPKGQGGRLPNLQGLGSLALTPGGLNPNLTPMTALEAIGNDQLSQERLADGERRRSKHRGSWRQEQGLAHWRSAIENYVATVQPGNQTELSTARSPFANYLNEIHQRLHDVFAFTFLPSLDRLPSDHALNRPDLSTHLEIVLSREDGRVVRMGVTRASGVTAFDVGALEAVQRAAPYGTPPREIVSPDGNVYLHWEFWRDPNYACSTYFARPYILRFAPKPAAPPHLPRPVLPEGNEQHGQTTPAPKSTNEGG